MIPPIDVTRLPAQAQRLLEPSTPPQLKLMAARAIVPGLNPSDLVTIVALLVHDRDAAIAETAKKTLANLPAPILATTLSADLEPAIIAELAALYIARADVMERILAMPRIELETVAEIAGRAGEQVTELIAVNEERMLANPRIIERLYLNKATRMSTADRIVEFAVRSNLELDIPAYKEVAAALGQELIAEPTEEPTPDDVMFSETLALGASMSHEALAKDTHARSDKGEEEVAEKFMPLYARIANMSIAHKVRAATLGSAAERMLLLRDSNRVVATAAIRSPLIQEPEVVMISASRVVSEDVLRAVAMNKDWLKNHQVKYNLVSNPRTPFVFAAKLIGHLREHELKALAKSKNVPGAIVTAAKQQLEKKKP